MKYCKENVYVEYTTINVNGKDYWVDEEGRLVIKERCGDVDIPVPSDRKLD